jgi:hypothetical protein
LHCIIVAAVGSCWCGAALRFYAAASGKRIADQNR